MFESIRKFLKQDAAGGILLVSAALLAMIVANTAANSLYQAWLSMPVSVSVGGFAIDKPLLLWINDGLMAIFFFLIGLEVKREILVGHLKSREQITLPAIAAVAGILVPALCYVAFNYQDPVSIRGWAVPAATDIAFALGVFSLFGKTLPVTLKLFLLSVAIFDDIGAILIIALFYSAELSSTSLYVALTGLAVLFVMNKLGVRSIAAFLLVGLVIWAAVLKSGVHATLAGFAVAFFIPLAGKGTSAKTNTCMLHKLEHGLHPWVAFLILPVFAFANAGVSLVGTSVEQIFNPIVLGIVAGLFIGKQLGIFAAAWLAVKMGFAKLPKGVTWLQMYGVSLLCGIGFTMSLFIGSLAFENMDASYLNSVKVGVLLGSLMSAILGGWIIAKCGQQKSAQHRPMPRLINKTMQPQ